MALLLAPSLLLCFSALATAVEAASRAGASKKVEDLVELNLDLPPDIQRMFEEMCELEGISQSEMLTRWIDARWEAMGYTDEDLEAYEAAQATEDEDTCAAGDGRCLGEDRAASSGRAAAAASSRDIGGGSPALGVRASGVPGAASSRSAAGGREAEQETPEAQRRATSSKEARAAGKKGRPAGAGGRPAGGPGRPQAGQAPKGAAGGRSAGGGTTTTTTTTSTSRREPPPMAAQPAKARPGGVRRAPSIGDDEDDEEGEEEEEEDGPMDLDAWMNRHSAGDEEEDEE